MISLNLSKEIVTMVRYFLLGAFGFGLGILLSWNFHENLNLSEPLSVGLSVVILFFFNFFMAREMVFKERNNLLKQAARFLVISLLMRSLEYGVFLLLFYKAEIYYLISYTTSIALIFVLKYFAYKKIVFTANH
jgi:putative flippase GtrA